MREQLSAIEAALPDYDPSFSAIEQQTQQIKTQFERIAASPSVSEAIGGPACIALGAGPLGYPVAVPGKTSKSN